jgi:hypothetical protein
MDIAGHAEALLRSAGYVTRREYYAGGTLAFEDDAVIGFLFTFDSGIELLETYDGREAVALATNTPALLAAGEKAWNVYSVFLTAEECKSQTERRLLRIEENLKRTRKIARASVTSARALQAALLPLLPLVARSEWNHSDYVERLEKKIANASDRRIAKAFFGPASTDEIAGMLQGSAV